MKNLINIKAVESITGISQHVIRAWEKRHNAIEPERTDSNHRLYSEEQITKLELLKKLTDNGYSIGRIAHLDLGTLAEMLVDIRPEYDIDRYSPSAPSFEEIINGCIDCTVSYKSKELEEILEIGVQEYGQILFLRKVVEPLLIKVGELWASGELRVSHEHFIAAVLKNVLTNLISANKVSSDAKSIILATVSGELHEMGCLMGGVVASSFGFKTVYLGTSLPAEEIIFSSKQNNSIIIFLGVVYPINTDETLEIIKKIQRYTNQNCDVVVAGNKYNLEHFKQLESIERIHLVRSQESFISYLQQVSG